MLMTLLILGFWIAVALFVFRIALYALIYLITITIGIVVWIVEKVRGE